MLCVKASVSSKLLLLKLYTRKQGATEKSFATEKKKNKKQKEFLFNVIIIDHLNISSCRKKFNENLMIY